MLQRVINRCWYVRFHDGEEWHAQPGEIINVLAADRPNQELYIQFDVRKRCGWFSWESVLWYSDKVFNE